MTLLVPRTKTPDRFAQTFRDFYGDRCGVERSDFHPLPTGAHIDDRLNYINGVPYPPKPPRARSGGKKPRGLVISP